MSSRTDGKSGRSRPRFNINESTSEVSSARNAETPQNNPPLEEVPDKDFDCEMQDYRPTPFTHTSRPSTYFVHEYAAGDAGFPIQEVQPNTNIAIESNLKRTGSSFLRNRHRAGLKSNSRISSILNMNNGGFSSAVRLQSFHDLGSPLRMGTPHSEVASSTAFPDEFTSSVTDPNELPIIVKPKVLYQNPFTSTVLPSTYQPINQWSALKNAYLKEFLAEWFGTMIMLFFTGAVVTQVNLGRQSQMNLYQAAMAEVAEAGGVDDATMKMFDAIKLLVTPTTAGTFDDVAFGWAAGVMIAWFAAGGSAISGAHLNPSITVASFIYKGFPLKKVPVYILGQYIGAFFGTLLAFGYYRKSVSEEFPDYRSSESVASFYFVYPKPYLTRSRQFVSELICTGLLQIGVFALTDPYTSLTNYIFPIANWILIYVIMASSSYQTGCAMNGARDMGPRLALYAYGFHHDIIWQTHRHFAWVPQVAPIIGSLLGGFLYDVFIYQGHESTVNWPLATHKAVLRNTFMTLFSRTPEQLRRKEHKKLQRTNTSSDESSMEEKKNNDDAKTVRFEHNKAEEAVNIPPAVTE
ncbi:hypothetical protein KAFR_0L00300 [Kazachstania africana CBS 2517]|uniref:Uncharacterized protein n=1 Tax=Kazachstania africana (strain ATCC 22294 / BCRC 22015 / CBS 2517 / CECT 1963 / NBRC 1671 / NRRL Y-8276) TaxID=1071382 RepID=H2B1Y7_KAZAF|nr:hypothetical protein KAFR_0L00300 [Kazachstania africana CBS 2517]CCF60637.1 hypothetical protein KAFR_0L00300 [Kazachstania africana CBS 2517]